MVNYYRGEFFDACVRMCVWFLCDEKNCACLGEWINMRNQNTSHWSHTETHTLHPTLTENYTDNAEHKFRAEKCVCVCYGRYFMVCMIIFNVTTFLNLILFCSSNTIETNNVSESKLKRFARYALLKLKIRWPNLFSIMIGALQRTNIFGITHRGRHFRWFLRTCAKIVLFKLNVR